jgi:hypothetical protein
MTLRFTSKGHPAECLSSGLNNPLFRHSVGCPSTIESLYSPFYESLTEISVCAGADEAKEHILSPRRDASHEKRNFRVNKSLPFVSESLERVHASAALNTHKLSASIQNAIRQVHAIFDLYNTTTSTSTAESLLSPDLALMTLQGAVFQSVDVFQSIDIMYQSPDFGIVGND